MSNQQIGVNVEEVIKQRPLQPISRVTVICGTDSDGAEVIRTAGDDSGREFTVSLPLLVGDPVTAQAVATNLLEDLAGYVYQPYEARGALLDPLARLGDAIFAGDVYSVLASRTIELDVLSPSDIAAPAKKAEDHEFPYTAQPDRAVTRRMARAESSIRINEGEIALRVIDATGRGASLTLTANGAAFADENGATVTINGGTIQAHTITADQIQANSITFSSLDSETQMRINSGLTEGEVRTVITDELVSSPTIAGGEFCDLQQQAFLKMVPYSQTDGYKLIFCTPSHDETDPLLTIVANDAGSGALGVYTDFLVGGDTFIRAYPDYNGYGARCRLTGDWTEVMGDISLYGEVKLDSDSYGSSLPTPTAADEGRLFFLVF